MLPHTGSLLASFLRWTITSLAGPQLSIYLPAKRVCNTHWRITSEAELEFSKTRPFMKISLLKRTTSAAFKAQLSNASPAGNFYRSFWRIPLRKS